MAWLKGIATRKKGDALFLSVPFTWLMSEAAKMADLHKGPVVIGGPGTMKPSNLPGEEPITWHNPDATFTTRGCPNKCRFCAVPILEGKFREIRDFRPAPIICDNNLLAASRAHLRRVVEAVKGFPEVDFNQGLDARRFTPEIADELGKLNCHVRFALDHTSLEGTVADAIALCKKKTTKKIDVYVLIGFNDTPDDALYRLELVRSWGLRPNPMRYQPLDAQKKNSYVGPGWTDDELRRMTRYYFKLRWLEHIPYSDYVCPTPREQLSLQFNSQSTD